MQTSEPGLPLARAVIRFNLNGALVEMFAPTNAGGDLAPATILATMGVIAAMAQYTED